MPKEGINYLPKDQLLSYEELLRISDLFAEMGVDKIRITGGEPFIRKDLIDFLEKLSMDKRLNKISITTNGILTKQFLPNLKALAINNINLSLDTIDEANFKKITRRDDFSKVKDTFHQLLDDGFKVKINAVIMKGINDHEIIDLAELALKYPVSVRFIEEMPFNGSKKNHTSIKWDYKQIFQTLKTRFPNIQKLPSPPNSTSENYIDW
jgi:cyclic pyranopterin phosphate synthase